MTHEIDIDASYCLYPECLWSSKDRFIPHVSIKEMLKAIELVDDIKKFYNIYQHIIFDFDDDINFPYYYIPSKEHYVLRKENAIYLYSYRRPTHIRIDFLINESYLLAIQELSQSKEWGLFTEMK